MNREIQELSHRTLSEGVEQIIRRMILNGDLQPSDRINEGQLAGKLSMSRGPIREALRRLQTEGLVVYHPHRGTYVATLSKKDAEEIYSLRGLLESEAARLALPRLNGEAMVRLQQLIGEFDQAQKNADLQALVNHDTEFHHIVVRAAGHARLFEMYKQLDTQLAAMFFTIRTRAPQRFLRLASLHQELVDALQSGDEEVVVQAFREHYDQAWQAIGAGTKA